MKEQPQYLLFVQTPTGREYLATVPTRFDAHQLAVRLGLRGAVIERDGRIIDKINA